MAALWLAAIPSGIWATKTLGNTLHNSLFAGTSAEPPNLLLDYEGALASAEAALKFHPVSPTALHLRRLVKESMDRLNNLVLETKARIDKHSWSRIFRNPDFSRENALTTAEIDRLKSRVSLFLSVVQLFPTNVPVVEDITFARKLGKDHVPIDSDDEESDTDSAEKSTYSTDDSLEKSNGSSTKDLTDISEIPPDVQDGLGPLTSSFWQNMIARAAL